MRHYLVIPSDWSIDSGKGSGCSGANVREALDELELLKGVRYVVDPDGDFYVARREGDEGSRYVRTATCVRQTPVRI